MKKGMMKKGMHGKSGGSGGVNVQTPTQQGPKKATGGKKK